MSQYSCDDPIYTDGNCIVIGFIVVGSKAFRDVRDTPFSVRRIRDTRGSTFLGSTTAGGSKAINYDAQRSQLRKES
jgi:hypothetical protein